MLSLPDDLLVSVFGDWTDPHDLCRASIASTKSLRKLFQHSGFILKPDRYLSNACLAWLSLKEIKVKLVMEHTAETHGFQQWKVNGELHRDNDLPAVIFADGTQNWYQNGIRHRDNDLPAVVWGDGDLHWYKNGQLHRDGNLPAIIYTIGYKAWYQNGIRHRENGLPSIVWKSDLDW